MVAGQQAQVDAGGVAGQDQYERQFGDEPNCMVLGPTWMTPNTRLLRRRPRAAYTIGRVRIVP
jgi:hypothetical protein